MTRIRFSILMGAAALNLPAAAIAQAQGVKPGQWETTVTVTSVEMPGVYARQADAMRGKVTKRMHCITPEAAARDPQDVMGSSKTCKVTHHSMALGRLSSEMVCRHGPGTMTATSTGSYTPDKFSTTGRAVSTGSPPMTMTTTSVGRRVGSCQK